jgi:hypothetical protein
MVCAADDPACIFCGYKISDTSAALKKEGMSKKSKTTAVLFMVVGSVIFNTMIGPAYFHNSGERFLAAGAVGAVCAVMGMIVGNLLSSD